MNKLITILGIAFALIATSAPTHAATVATGSSVKSLVCFFAPHKCDNAVTGNKSPKKDKGWKKPKKHDYPKHNYPKPTPVPEINGASAGLAFAFLAGMVSIARERRRKRQS